MPYSGPIPVATLDNFLAALVGWAVTNAGFTDEGTTAAPSGRNTDMYRISKGGMYWWFMGYPISYGYSAGVIEMRMQTALPTAANYSSNSVGPNEITRCDLYANHDGPYTAYNFFSDAAGTVVHAVLEVFPNVFNHISFGEVTKYGTWPGGQYLTTQYYRNTTNLMFSGGTPPFADHINSSSYGSFVHYPKGAFGDYRDYAEFGTKSNDQWAAGCTFGATETTTTTSHYASPFGMFWGLGPNGWNQRAALWPQYLLLYRPTLDRLFLAGHVPGVKFVHMGAIEPKDVVESEWEVFPLTQKAGDIAVAPISLNSGLAYQRVA